MKSKKKKKKGLGVFNGSFETYTRHHGKIFRNL